MVISLGPGKFYGTSLPRPRFYTDVKFNDHRVDPPLPVNDPLMSWAEEAHWSMGGLSFNRLRFQGKIEGNVEKLRSQREKQSKAQAQAQSPASRSDLYRSKRASSPSPPPAPVAVKHRRRFTDEMEEEEEVRVVKKRRLVKKLGDDFDRVASEGSDGVMSSDDSPMVSRTRSRRLVKVGDAMKKKVQDAEKSSPKGKKSDNNEAEKKKNTASVSGNGVRTSPRLAKRGSN